MKLVIAQFSLLFLLAEGTFAESEGRGKGRNQNPGKESKGDRSPGKGPRNPEFRNQLFQRLDENQDGKVSPEEFAANPRLERATAKQREALFQRLDKNDDGLIERNEMKAPKRRGREGRPPWLRNGPVNFEQFAEQPRVQRLDPAAQRRLFERMDQNGDGVLSKEDLPRQRGPRPNGEPRPLKAFETVDSDGDGQISFSEFQQEPLFRRLGEDEAEDRFEEIDKDSDGLLSSDEWQQAPRPKREKREKQKPRN